MGGRAAAILAGGASSRAASILAEPEDEQSTAPDMVIDEAIEVPADYSPRGILERLLHGNAQRDAEKYQAQMNAQGVHPERELHPSDAYIGLMSPLGAAGKGAMGVAKSAANEVITGTATAALQELRNGASPRELLESVLKSGATSGAVDLGLQGVGAVGRGAGGLLTKLGGKARNVVAGGTKKEAEAILEHYDQPEAIDERLGGLLEKYSPSPWYGRSSSGYLKDIKRQIGDEGIHYDATMDQAVAEGVNDALPQAWANVQSRATDDALGAMERPIGKAGRQRAAEYASVADDVKNLSQPDDIRAFGYEKSLVQSDAAPDNIISRSIGDSAADAATGNLGRIYRDELEGAMSTADPRTFQDFTGSRDTYRDLSTLRDLLKSKTAAEQSGGDFGNAISGALLGTGAGVAGSALTPGEDTGMLGMGGAVAGLATGTRSALRQAAGSWGADMGANILKGTGAVARGIGNTLDRAPVGALTGSTMANGNDTSRGYLAAERVGQIMKQNPALLGEYAEQFQDAEAIPQTVSRLIEEDAQFRMLMRQLTSRSR